MDGFKPKGTNLFKFDFLCLSLSWVWIMLFLFVDFSLVGTILTWICLFHHSLPCFMAFDLLNFIEIITLCFLFVLGVSSYCVSKFIVSFM